jgi:cytoskeletal protein RodZ
MLLSDSSANEASSHVARQTHSAGPGALLRRARERRGLTLEQIANETKIHRRDLEALEHDDNLAVGLGEFYRRAKIRAYARAVHLDQNLALAEDHRPEPPVTDDSPVIDEPERTPFRLRVLIVIGVAVAAAVLGRPMGARAPALEADAQVRSTADAPQQRGARLRETPSDIEVATSPLAQVEHVVLAASPSDSVLAVQTEPVPVDDRMPTASNGGPSGTTEQNGARASRDSVTELVVTTQPAGARVTVNGIGWGITPVTIRYLPGGDKRIRVSKEGYATEDVAVRLTEGHPRMVDIPLRSAP